MKINTCLFAVERILHSEMNWSILLGRGPKYLGNVFVPAKPASGFKKHMVILTEECGILKRVTFPDQMGCFQLYEKMDAECKMRLNIILIEAQNETCSSSSMWSFLAWYAFIIALCQSVVVLVKREAFPCGIWPLFKTRSVENGQWQVHVPVAACNSFTLWKRNKSSAYFPTFVSDLLFV